jgi:hypothetical protein
MNMVFRVFLFTLVIRSARSGLCFIGTCGEGVCFRGDQSYLTSAIGTEPLPSLYEADIDILAAGLESNKFTSVDLVKASRLE